MPFAEDSSPEEIVPLPGILHNVLFVQFVQYETAHCILLVKHFDCHPYHMQCLSTHWNTLQGIFIVILLTAQYFDCQIDIIGFLWTDSIIFKKIMIRWCWEENLTYSYIFVEKCFPVKCTLCQYAEFEGSACFPFEIHLFIASWIKVPLPSVGWGQRLWLWVFERHRWEPRLCDQPRVWTRNPPGGSIIFSLLGRRFHFLDFNALIFCV